MTEHNLREGKRCEKCRWAEWSNGRFCTNPSQWKKVVSAYNVCSLFEEKKDITIEDMKGCMNCKNAVDCGDHWGWSTCTITGQRNHNYMVCDEWTDKTEKKQ